MRKFFHFKFVKMKNLFTFLALKQPNSEAQKNVSLEYKNIREVY